MRDPSPEKRDSDKAAISILYLRSSCAISVVRLSSWLAVSSRVLTFHVARVSLDDLLLRFRLMNGRHGELGYPPVHNGDRQCLGHLF